MAWAFANYYAPATMACLDDQDVTTVTVLEDSNLVSCMRSSLPKLVEFILRPNTMNELMDWALTTIHSDHERFSKISRSAVTVLSTTSSNFQRKYKESQEFIERLNQFPSTEYSNNPRCCGNFGKIVEQILRTTSGEFADMLASSLRLYMINHLHIAACRDLFNSLLCDFGFEVDSQFFVDLAENAHGLDGYNIIAGIKTLVQQTNSQYPSMVANERFFEKIFNVIIDSETPLFVVCESFNLLVAILSLVKEDIRQSLKPCIQAFSEQYNLPEREISPISGCAIKLFKVVYQKAVEAMFNNPGDTFLSAAVVDNILELKGDDLHSVVEQNDLLNKIISAITNKDIKTAGQITRLAKYLNSVYETDDQKWLEFKAPDGPLQERLMKIHQNYGGDRPRSISSSEEESDDLGTEQTCMNDDNNFFVNNDDDDDDEEDDDDDCDLIDNEDSHSDSSYDDDSDDSLDGDNSYPDTPRPTNDDLKKVSETELATPPATNLPPLLDENSIDTTNLPPPVFPLANLSAEDVGDLPPPPVLSDDE